MNNPPERKDILDEVPDPFKEKKVLSKSIYVDKNIERLFPDSYFNKKESPKETSLQASQKTPSGGEKKYITVKRRGLDERHTHHMVPNHAATRDNMTEIFKNGTYDVDGREPKITPKPNADDFQTFSASARKVAMERYNF